MIADSIDLMYLLPVTSTTRVYGEYARNAVRYIHILYNNEYNYIDTLLLKYNTIQYGMVWYVDSQYATINTIGCTRSVYPSTSTAYILHRIHYVWYLLDRPRTCWWGSV
jgi:hypothetical protein